MLKGAISLQTEQNGTNSRKLRTVMRKVLATVPIFRENITMQNSELCWFLQTDINCSNTMQVVLYELGQLSLDTPHGWAQKKLATAIHCKAVSKI